MSVVSAHLVHSPRKTHRCVGHQCGTLLHATHIRAFCLDRNEGIEPQTLRLCIDCARRWDDPKLRPLTAKPHTPRTPGADRTLPQRFADLVRQVQLWQDGVNEPEIAETLGLSLQDLGNDFRLVGVDGDTVLAMAAKMAHATAWPKCYRNHYVAGSDDVASWEKLVAFGLASRGREVSYIEGAVFAVTEAGKQALEEMGEAVPRG